MQLPLRKIFWILAAITIALLVIYTFNILSIHFLAEPLPDFFLARFNIDGESNIPTWYSSILHFSVAAAALLILSLNKSDRAGRIYWWVVLIVFCFLSLDETAMLHELFDLYTPIKWFVVYIPLALLFAAYCLFYWRAQQEADRQPGRMILTGLAIFLIGAGVLEWIVYTFPLPYAWRQVEYVLEEGLEMLGVIMVLTGSLMEFNRLQKKTDKPA